MNVMKELFNSERWTQAIEKGFQKNINQETLRLLSLPQTRIDLYTAMCEDRYVIEPPHEAQIPKDDGSMRTVYVNTPTDRVLLSIFNNILFETCSDMIHPRCKSYQKTIGCGKIVKEAVATIKATDRNTFGVKIDLSKYFDTVKIEYIEDTFDKIEAHIGKNPMLDAVRKYYRDSTVYDMDKNLIEKYTSLRQGCAIAAFLADAVLYDIDEAISKFDVFYVRYSDDILIIGEEWKAAEKVLVDMLAAKGLTINPKKRELLNKYRRFKFLGYTIKDQQISLSKSRVKNFQREIEARTINIRKPEPIEKTVLRVNRWLYGEEPYSWADSILPVINIPKDIDELNKFVMDAIKAKATGKTRIGGLGVTAYREDVTILRGKGRNVRMNRTKVVDIPNYNTISCMQKIMLTSRDVYNAVVLNMIEGG